MFSLIECRLETGRTHQIRAHMKFLGHLYSTTKWYGGNKVVKGTVFSKYKQFVDNCFKIIPRQRSSQDAWIRSPGTQKFIQFDSELPEDFHPVMENGSTT